MRTPTRVMASILTLGMTLTACGGHGGGSLLPSTTQSGPTNLAPHIQHVYAGVPRTSGAFATSDLGRRGASTPTKINVLLNYRNQAELDQLVQDQANPASPMFHHYLSTEEFNARFAPTAEDYAKVEAQLRAQGFTVAQEYANRTIITAIAPTTAIEKTFGTEIHSVSQGKFGQRYMNVKPATMPDTLASYVKDVTLNNLVQMHPLMRHQVARSITPPAGGLYTRRMAITPYVTNVVTNPGFESGAVNNGWFQCGNVNASVTTSHPHGGYYDEKSGNGTSEPNGDTGVCQSVTIPSSGQLSVWLYQLSNEGSTAYAYQEADLLDAYGNVVDNLYTSSNNYAGWVNKKFDLSAYAGGTYYLYFGVHGDGYAYLYTQQFVDDVSLTSGSVPTPSPTPVPTASPTPVPTASPTPKPTASPTATPTPAPTATPTATPTPVAGGCNGSAALTGASKQSNGGWLAAGVAKAFDYPVQHGCNGAGQTVAIEIDTAILTSDVSAYLSAAGVTQTGTITNISVDSAPTNTTSQDYGETALDVETVSGLAPGTNIRVYYFPDLSSQSIEDGYNKTVSDGIATVVNSSFGGCETGDTAFTNTTNSIAQQAAAKGITFNASSGDSGSNECGTSNNALGVSSPSSDPYFVAIGAVDFTATSTGALSTITAGSDSSNGFSSGGGVSTVFALPSYQSGISGVNSSGRNNPDVSLPGVGVAVYMNGAWQKFDGTSWSSPAFTALMSEVEQLRGTHYGFVNPNIYTLFKNTGFTDYTDVTSGTNGAYNAVTGYDLVTGIGAPKGWAFANNL